MIDYFKALFQSSNMLLSPNSPSQLKRRPSANPKSLTVLTQRITKLEETLEDSLKQLKSQMQEVSKPVEIMKNSSETDVECLKVDLDK
jgi:hypothetical protein